MKKLLTALCLSLWLCLGLIAPLSAQEGVTLSPAQITVAGTRAQRETRTLLIRTTAPITGLRVVPLDLSGPEGDVVLPAEVMRVDPSPVDIGANALYTVPITFDLTDAPSGQFTGEVLVSYGSTALTVPVSVAVKDPPWFALLALVVGVALGVGVSNYRAQGRPRDEVLVQLGQVRTQMRADEALREKGEPFRKAIESELVDVQAALDSQQWDRARESLAKAERTLTNWRRSRPDWLVQLAYYQKIEVQLESQSQESLYIQEVMQAAQDCYRELPELAEPGLFREKLEPLAQQANAFTTLKARISALEEHEQGQARARALRQQLHTLKPGDEAAYTQLRDAVEAAIAQAEIRDKVAELETMCAYLPEAEAQAWLDKAQDYRRRIAALPQAEEPEAAYAELVGDVETALREVKAQLGREPTRSGPQPDLSMTPKGIEGVPASVEMLTNPPRTTVQPLQERVAGAGRRLRWFTWLTYGIAVIFLALAGFVELYDARLDFGVNGLGDYFTLLAWGFGAEATRAAVAEMVQGWGISPRT